MEQQKDKNKDNTGTSGTETIRRGESAIEADKQINEKDKSPADKKKDEEKDAAKWHAEG
jgi:hypothetical protein